MKVLLGTAYDLRQQSHIQPVEVPELVHYPLYSLEPHLNTTVPKEFTGGEVDTVRSTPPQPPRDAFLLVASAALLSCVAIESFKSPVAFLSGNISSIF